MLILSRVCADFYDKRNNLLFRITQKDLGLFVDAPEAIREDPLFQLLVDDKSIKFPEDARTNRALENDPYAGATAEGKEIAADGADAEGREVKAAKPKTTKSKSAAKAETKAEAQADAAAMDQPADVKAE